MSTVPNLATLPAPDVVDALDFEQIFTAHRADLLARWPALAGVIDLESEPLNKLVQAHAYRELLYRQRVNEAARAHLLAFAGGADLDQLGAFYGIQRLADEDDEHFRQRIQLRIRALAGQGTAEHYELLAMSTSPNVRAARATSPQAGSVVVLLWLHDESAAAQTLAEVLAALNAEDARMLGVPVTVQQARARTVNVTARITRAASAPTNMLTTLAELLAQRIAAYSSLGRDLARSQVTAWLHVDGVAAVEYPDDAAPPVLTSVADDEYLLAGAITLTDAGVAS